LAEKWRQEEKPKSKAFYLNMRKFLRVFLWIIIISFITHFMVMFLFLKTPFLSLPEKLIPDRVLLAITEYELKGKDCNLFCFIAESWKITIAYFRRGPGFYDYAIILNDKTKNSEIRSYILSLINSDLENNRYAPEEDKELYAAILKIAADKNEDQRLREECLNILKLVKNNDPKAKEIALEIIKTEPDNPFSGLKVSATKLLVKESPGDIDALFELLKNPDSSVNSNAGRSLIMNYPRETYWRISEIVEIAKNENYKPSVRAEALMLVNYLHQIFGNIDQNTINSLKLLLNDKKGGIRGLTAEILEKITGEKYGFEPGTEEEEEEILW